MDDNDDAYGETFGPEYVRPRGADCIGCRCCTADLCAKGRASVLRCAGHVGDGHRDLVAACPCSAECSPGSMAWRTMRVRATLFALYKPLPALLEPVLAAVDEGREVADRGGVLSLSGRRMIDAGPDGLRVTPFGRQYLSARRDAWAPTALLVHDVDQRTRTARVVVVARASERPVIVAMDQLASNVTKVTPAQLPGMFLYGRANVAALLDEDVVIVDVRNPRITSPLVAFRAGALAAAGRAGGGE